jgi:hypothetical protein
VKNVWREHLIICLSLGLLSILDLALMGGGDSITLDFRGLILGSHRSRRDSRNAPSVWQSARSISSMRRALMEEYLRLTRRNSTHRRNNRPTDSTGNNPEHNKYCTAPERYDSHSD